MALPDGRGTRMGRVLVASGSIGATFGKRPIAVALSERISMSHNYMVAGSAGLTSCRRLATSVL